MLCPLLSPGELDKFLIDIPWYLSTFRKGRRKLTTVCPKTINFLLAVRVNFPYKLQFSPRFSLITPINVKECWTNGFLKVSKGEKVRRTPLRNKTPPRLHNIMKTQSKTYLSRASTSRIQQGQRRRRELLRFATSRGTKQRGYRGGNKESIANLTSKGKGLNFALSPLQIGG